MDRSPTRAVVHPAAGRQLHINVCVRCAPATQRGCSGMRPLTGQRNACPSYLERHNAAKRSSTPAVGRLARGVQESPRPTCSLLSSEQTPSTRSARTSGSRTLRPYIDGWLQSHQHDQRTHREVRTVGGARPADVRYVLVNIATPYTSTISRAMMSMVVNNDVVFAWKDYGWA
ncbi:hypothetical protein BAUCODRAFT_239976 [Baudoinia panamericana UAMH 10762]|uniref:Uncharacterized protein n=1 Tax=Baudoinia panamericana (strain UAMH 10762) TaxID=717646 RepID=M2LH18_BAUPA|nr:uncharacterized protein BAUCODRAFT_239976 [Baudoinia panamericana UAMH 10762]EMC93417.1 hypothetical protein BAUCODRAFT_239976 [Baudoinia panamericana UAMH 10762]